MSSNRLYRPALGAVIAVLLSTAACRQGVAEPAAAAATTSGDEAIEVTRVVSRALDTTARLDGDLSAYEWVAIFARVDAFVQTVAVDRGSVVHEGERLVTLVAPELAAQRTEAEARAHASQSTYAKLQEASKTPGAVAGNELAAAADAAASAKAKVESLRALESYLVVTAPFDAVDTERNVHPGALVGPRSSTPMLRLEEQKRLRLTVSVPEPLVALVPDGETVHFSVRGRPGETFAGTIHRSAHSIDLHTRTMAVELDVDNTSRELEPGMFAEVTWPVRRATPTLFVPQSAVVVSSERTFVVKVAGGVLAQVPVRRGATMGDLVEVFGDLAAGDLIIRRANEEYRTGTRVAATREVK
jgi:RND family efflux transporter MFP subunit